MFVLSVVDSCEDHAVGFVVFTVDSLNISFILFAVSPVNASSRSVRCGFYEAQLLVLSAVESVEFSVCSVSYIFCEV